MARTSDMSPHEGVKDMETSSQVEHPAQVPVAERVQNRTWYRTTFFNGTVVALCAFIAPGLWAAMNGLGAGGAASPYYVNAANSVIFVLQFVVCIFGSAIISRIGLKWAFVSGMIGFPIYAASLYTHVKYSNNWFLMLACVIDGIFSGIFWLTEGAIILAYPEKHNRGKYLAYWLGLRIVGQMIGGSVSLGVNARSNQKGAISVNTYLVFISIQVLGPFVAALLSNPSQVQRSDGTKVEVNLPKSLKTELQAMWRVLCRKEILLLTPMMFQSVFSGAFFSTYNATYFTVRSRALASLVASGCVIFANFGLGFFLDSRRMTVNSRALSAFVFIYAFEAGLYVYAMIVCKDFESRAESPVFDWIDDGFGRAVCVYILMLVGFNLMYDYLYWLVGTVNKDGGDIVRLSAMIRGIESCGQAISYGINSIDQSKFALSGAVAVNMSFFAACILPAGFVIWKVGIVNGVKVHAIVQDEEPEGVVPSTAQDSNDSLAEFHLPRSGIELAVDRMPFPRLGNHSDRDGFMFLALCSIRRLLNRIHNAVYASTNKEALSPSNASDTLAFGSTGQHAALLVLMSLEGVCGELERQLDVWYESLPEVIKPDLSTTVPEDSQDAWLRLRYWSAKHIISRPSLIYAATWGEGTVLPASAMRYSEMCIRSSQNYLETVLHTFDKRTHYSWMAFQA
ncbi:hypothetical protein CkaCkLH20_08572 [Colletotrichum karsti]|uniref:UNC93-like protein n=1 Tax=Colletotrichum karsti TaxID=1095194 RepID=A0A9P6LHQ4_9PEZI|nr:uncharacterized protein CkaCkLH20_08572 [Colletotrichum karsti]KAF9873838.1 hypothetical protein CkaCkLH20_08572 [Colletotrichum karsti]